MKTANGIFIESIQVGKFLPIEILLDYNHIR